MKKIKNTTWKLRLESSDSLKHQVRYIFNDAKKNHLSHDEISQFLFDNVYQVDKYKTLPNYMRAEINGYIYANFDIMYEYLEWVHWYNGEFVGRELPYGEGFDQNLINESNHVYIGTQDKY